MMIPLAKLPELFELVLIVMDATLRELLLLKNVCFEIIPNDASFACAVCEISPPGVFPTILTHSPTTN